MSLSSALNSALTGLSATSRRAEVTSDNIANAMTPGFSKRRVEVASDILNGRGSGVRVTNVMRVSDPAATASRRAMSAEAGAATVTHEAASEMARVLGEPGQIGALANRFSEFDAALVAAASEPGGQSHLDNGVARGIELAKDLNRISDNNMSLRQDADWSIGEAVKRINNNLDEIQRLNVEISNRKVASGDTNSLEDSRQKMIDEVAEMIPLRVIRRQNDQIALFSNQGVTLIDGLVNKLEFTPKAMITHDMNVASGALSTIIVDDDEVEMGSGAGPLDGGRLGALFAVRDYEVPEFNGQIDALARDLIERFQDPAVDTTLAVGDMGIFTDAGTAFDATNELGIAGRIEINTALDPNGADESWRLRAGMNATDMGEIGDNTILRNFEAAMQGARTPSAASGIHGAMGAASFAAEVTSQRAYDGAFKEERSAYASGQLSILEEYESARTGVDTDEELQMLMEIEKAYAANARVMATIDQLFDRLMEI